MNSLFVDTLHWRQLWIFAGIIWAGRLAHRRVPAPVAAPALVAAREPGANRGRVALAMTGVVICGALLAGLRRGGREIAGRDDRRGER